MNRKSTPIFVLLILTLVTLACSPCGLLGGGDAPAPTQAPAPTIAPAPADTPEPPPAPAADLGEELRSEMGGFAFHPCRVIGAESRCSV